HLRCSRGRRRAISRAPMSDSCYWNASGVPGVAGRPTIACDLFLTGWSMRHNGQEPLVPDKSRRPLSLRSLVRSSKAAQSAGRALALCDALLSEQGEVSGRRLATYALSAYQSLDEAGRDIFFDRLLKDFAPDAAEVDRAAARYRADASSANLIR